MKAEINNDLTKKFHKGTIWMHWLTAIFIGILVLSSLKIAGFEALERSLMIKLHLFFGSFIFIFTIVRTYLFFKKEQPENIKTGSKFVDKLVVWNHNLFYLFLVGISIMGIIVVVDGQYIDGLINGIDRITPQKEISMLKYHVLATFLMILLAIVHVFGVVKHYAFTRENTLKRIF
ncbi:MAG: cytochrome b/b6 domain-containing protein [Bacteroidota bacterium]